jgi:bifunctional UDP-N-acetylglucosamine pyrophosphorylase / glucosamine-1-phosphate N-acetyltransferase
MTAGALAAVVLAAGRGVRMRTTLPKTLHEVAGRPLLEHVLAALEPLAPARRVVVVGYGAEAVIARLARDDVDFAHQEALLGTGDALRAAGRRLGPWRGDVVVVNGDDVLLEAAALRRLLDAHREGGAGMTLLTYEVEDPRGLGRIVRGPEGSVEQIVEERDADTATRALREVNPGSYVFDASVWELLEGLDPGNRAGEYYLTDVVAAYLAAGAPVRAVRGEHDGVAPLGVNDREQLARAERSLQGRLARRWLAEGVTMVAPASTFLDADVLLAPDVVLEPGVILRRGTVVGAGARIGAYAVLDGCNVEPGALVAPHTVATSQRFAPAVAAIS